MKRTSPKIIELPDSSVSEAGKLCIGRIVQITTDGKAIVDYPGNPGQPSRARSTLNHNTRFDAKELIDAQVLLAFENQDPLLPIIVGILHDTLFAAEPIREVTLPVSRPDKAVMDGKFVLLDAENEITLRCGKSSLTLRRDGKIVVKGVEVASRATRANKLKGRTVKIN